MFYLLPVVSIEYCAAWQAILDKTTSNCVGGVNHVIWPILNGLVDRYIFKFFSCESNSRHASVLLFVCDGISIKSHQSMVMLMVVVMEVVMMVVGVVMMMVVKELQRDGGSCCEGFASQQTDRWTD